MLEYEPVIGFEIHAELATASKVFCGCSTEPGAPPNTHTCPICLGLPGVLPVLNRRALEFALKVALACHCQHQFACHLRTQELLLSRSAEKLPDLAETRAYRAAWLV